MHGCVHGCVRRFLKSSMRDEFQLHGIPIRFLVRTSENPYAPRRQRLRGGSNVPEGLRKLEHFKAKRSLASRI